MVLVDEGLLDLDEDISAYLGYEVRNSSFPDVPITSRMLMQHTSSIFDSSDFQASRDRNSSESTQHLLNAGTSYRNNRPGLSFEYTNFGFAVLGAVCEMVSGKTLDTLARDAIFEPLEIDAAYVAGNLRDTINVAAIYNARHVMTRSVQAQLEIGESGVLGRDNHLAQGNLTISAVDFAKILVMLGNGGSLRDVRVLSEESVHEIHDSIVQGEGYLQGLATRYLYEAFMPDIGSFWHTGSGNGAFAQYAYNAGSLNRGVVVVTTGANTGRSPNGLIRVCTDLSALAWTHLLGD
jgi:CubicO group peptidase (beta-lactamase class C family)